MSIGNAMRSELSAQPLEKDVNSVYTPLASASEGRSRKMTLMEDVVRLDLGGLSHERAHD